jgi:hypothetical protein
MDHFVASFSGASVCLLHFSCFPYIPFVTLGIPKVIYEETRHFLYLPFSNISPARKFVRQQIVSGQLDANFECFDYNEIALGRRH